MPIPDSEKLHVQLVINGQIAALGATAQLTASILHYRRTSSTPDFVAASFINAWQANCETNWLAAASSSWAFKSYHARCINDATDAGTVETITTAGGVTGDCLPAFNTQLITKQTALRGRSYRGRLFFPSVPESGVDGNTLTAGQLALLQAVADDLDDGLTDADGNTYVPFLLSVIQSTIASNPTNIVGADITSCTAKDDVAVNRSRRARA